ncbi:hypothetical protein J7K07_00460 [Candidatus Bathyarchaeota archaeon]|nr:hypothetical protein [Candidatus Bathyarchaeota archaeon]
MSKRYDFIPIYAERVLGVLLILIGAALTYNTYIDPSVAGLGANYFMSLGVFLIFLGLLILAVKIK